MVRGSCPRSHRTITFAILGIQTQENHGVDNARVGYSVPREATMRLVITVVLTEAWCDQGANGYQTSFSVLLHELAAAFLAGGIPAIVLSLDKVIVNATVAGRWQTLAIRILGELVRPRRQAFFNRFREASSGIRARNQACPVRQPADGFHP